MRFIPSLCKLLRKRHSIYKELFVLQKKCRRYCVVLISHPSAPRMSPTHKDLKHMHGFRPVLIHVPIWSVGNWHHFMTSALATFRRGKCKGTQQMTYTRNVWNKACGRFMNSFRYGYPTLRLSIVELIRESTYFHWPLWNIWERYNSSLANHFLLYVLPRAMLTLLWPYEMHDVLI